MTMKRVLFVDDEPNVLDGLRRMLYSLRREWHMSFVSGAREALQLLELESYDVLVTDMQMPGMSGTELLTEVIERHPHVLRVVLSGTADQGITMRTVMLAHQFLVKPCDPEILKATLDRIYSLRVILQEPALKRLIARIHTLPSLPSTYMRLMDALRSAEPSAAQIGAIIAGDIAMTAKVLQLINSSFFGLRRQIADPREAVLYLGTDTVRALALTVAAFAQFDTRAGSRFSLETLSSHAMAVAVLAQKIGKSLKLEKPVVDEVFSAGLLHDVGRLVLASNCPQDYEAALDEAAQAGIPIRHAEQQIFGTTHAEVGAYLLWLWGLPVPVVEAVALHHLPADVDPSSTTMLVHIAEALLTDDDAEPFHEAALAAMNRCGKTPEWRNLALEMAAGELQS
jgi:HD-like signal output (HDOD) protein/ActR/RegA family two-component response regulator